MAMCPAKSAKQPTSSELLEEFLRCMVCFEPYKSPKVLQCQHTFCEECIRRWNVKGGGSKNGVSCPTCRMKTPLDKDIEGLPSDFKLTRLGELLQQVLIKESADNRCCDICAAGNHRRPASHFCAQCSESFCGECYKRHSVSPLLASHHVVDLALEDPSGKLFCTQHGSKPIRYICQDCNLFICTVCAINIHNEHDVHELETGLRKYTDELEQLSFKIHEKLANVQAVHEQLLDLQVSLKGYHDDLEEQIDAHITSRLERTLACQYELQEMVTSKSFGDSMASILWAIQSMQEAGKQGISQQANVVLNQIKDVRRDLIGQLKDRYSTISQEINDSIDNLAFHVASIESLSSFLDKLMRARSPLEVITVYEELTTRAKSILDCDIESFAPTTFSLITYKPEEGEYNLGNLNEEVVLISEFLSRESEEDSGESETSDVEAEQNDESAPEDGATSEPERTEVNIRSGSRVLTPIAGSVDHLDFDDDDEEEDATDTDNLIDHPAPQESDARPEETQVRETESAENNLEDCAGVGANELAALEQLESAISGEIETESENATPTTSQPTSLVPTADAVSVSSKTESATESQSVAETDSIDTQSTSSRDTASGINPCAPSIVTDNLVVGSASPTPSVASRTSSIRSAPDLTRREHDNLCRDQSKRMSLPVTCDAFKLDLKSTSSKGSSTLVGRSATTPDIEKQMPWVKATTARAMSVDASLNGIHHTGYSDDRVRMHTSPRPSSDSTPKSDGGKVDFLTAHPVLVWEKEGTNKMHSVKRSKRHRSTSSSTGTAVNPDLRNPTDVCFLSNGDLIIADNMERNLQILSADTVMWSRVKDRKQPLVTSRAVAWNLVDPVCLAIAPKALDPGLEHKELVVITDSKDKCVKLIDIQSKGSCVAMWGKSWFNPIFKNPSGLAITPEGKWLVSDIGKHSVTLNSPEGSSIHQFGSRGKGTFGFECPRYVAIDGRGRMLVSDSGNGGVKVYDSNAQFLFKIGSAKDGHLTHPMGLVIDHAGNIIVADKQRHWINLFASDGRLLRTLLNADNGIHSPCGVAVTDDGKLAVTQTDPPTVKLFQFITP